MENFYFYLEAATQFELSLKILNEDILKKKYHALARENHPDFHPSSEKSIWEEKFKKIGEYKNRLTNWIELSESEREELVYSLLNRDIYYSCFEKIKKNIIDLCSKFLTKILESNSQTIDSIINDYKTQLKYIIRIYFYDEIDAFISNDIGSIPLSDGIRTKINETKKKILLEIENILLSNDIKFIQIKINEIEKTISKLKNILKQYKQEFEDELRNKKLDLESINQHGDDTSTEDVNSIYDMLLTKYTSAITMTTFNDFEKIRRINFIFNSLIEILNDIKMGKHQNSHFKMTIFQQFNFTDIENDYKLLSIIMNYNREDMSFALGSAKGLEKIWILKDFIPSGGVIVCGFIKPKDNFYYYIYGYCKDFNGGIMKNTISKSELNKFYMPLKDFIMKNRLHSFFNFLEEDKKSKKSEGPSTIHRYRRPRS